MLDGADFARVAAGGFGDPHNSYAWSMEWFKGRLYVGTSRDLLSVFRKIGNYHYLEPCPVALPSLTEMDLRAQIWRFTPRCGTWEKVYTSPLIVPFSRESMRARRVPREFRGRPGLNHLRLVNVRRAGVLLGELLHLVPAWARAGFKLEVGRELGYRTMAVHTDDRGAQELLVASLGPWGRMLRTADGVTFDETGAFSFRPLVSFKGRLFGSPVRGAWASSYPGVLERRARVGETSGAGAWLRASTPGFGDPTNLSVFEMAVFKDHLYAGTANLEGFQVWKTDANGDPPYRWRQVLKYGGYTSPSAIFGAVSMCALGDWLYVGSGRAPSALERFEPTPGEVIRIAPDDSWELVAGEPRETQQGSKSPISGMPALFGNPFAMYVWRMDTHRGWLYAGTHDATTLLRYTPKEQIGPRARRWIEGHGGVDNVTVGEAGFDLWRTNDGRHWTCVTRTGFGNPFNHGARTLRSTPEGLFIGTANFFTDARDPRTGEARGGTEIWLGKERQ